MLFHRRQIFYYYVIVYTITIFYAIEDPSAIFHTML